jgi:hypothetical protein
MYKPTAPAQTRKITPDEARKLLAINNFPGQRPLQPLKARGYADKMTDGSMRPVGIAIMTMKDGQKYLANGQHCLQAIVINDKPFTAFIEHYKCETNDDAWHLFASFDVHPTRTERNIMKAARGLFSCKQLQDVPLRALTNCGSALFMLGSGTTPKFTGQPSNKAAKADLVQAYRNEVLWVSKFAAEEHLGKVAIAAAMIATYRSNKDAADEFWSLVAEGATPGLTHKFRDRLLKNEIGRNNVGGGHNKSRLIYAECVAYWNSWMKGEDRRKVMVAAMKDIPKVESRKAA